MGDTPQEEPAPVIKISVRQIRMLCSSSSNQLTIPQCVECRRLKRKVRQSPADSAD